MKKNANGYQKNASLSELHNNCDGYDGFSYQTLIISRDITAHKISREHNKTVQVPIRLCYKVHNITCQQDAREAYAYF